MKKKITLVLILVCTTIFSQEKENCVFESDWLKEEMLKGYEEVELYKWKPKEKKGEAIMRDGSLLFFKGITCTQSGFEITRIYRKELFDENTSKIILSIAKNFMYEGRYNHFRKKFNKKSFNDKLKLKGKYKLDLSEDNIRFVISSSTLGNIVTINFLRYID